MSIIKTVAKLNCFSGVIYQSSHRDLFWKKIWVEKYYWRFQSFTPANIYLSKVKKRNARKKWNMFRVNSKNIRTTSMTLTLSKQMLAGIFGADLPNLAKKWLPHRCLSWNYCEFIGSPTSCKTLERLLFRLTDVERTITYRSLSSSNINICWYVIGNSFLSHLALNVVLFL